MTTGTVTGWDAYFRDKEADMAIRTPTTHELKTHPDPFLAVQQGRKRFEVRAFDRDYRAGDRVLLREYDRDTGGYTGQAWLGTITYICWPGSWGLPTGVGVFGIDPA